MIYPCVNSLLLFILQVARVVMLAWGRSTRDKEQRAKREARKKALMESSAQAQA